MSEERTYGPHQSTLDEISGCNGVVGSFVAMDMVFHIRELQSQLARRERDAARYRWIRNQERVHIGNEDGDWRMGSSLQEPEQLDALIDDAMKGSHE